MGIVDSLVVHFFKKIKVCGPHDLVVSALIVVRSTEVY
jgi:hypothetical protein